ncbi:MAG: D-aminoacyl-tRNA deacylase [Bryobacteraceae bacterium]
MRIVLQRVTEAYVEVDGQVTGRINRGLMVLLGVARGDGKADADYLADKVTMLRIFPDDDGKMNRSLMDIGGGLLVVSQFTLYGDARKGRRPSFDRAAPPELARDLYNYFVETLRNRKIDVQTGVFQAMMSIHLVNEGPVTILLDSEKTP